MAGATVELLHGFVVRVKRGDDVIEDKVMVATLGEAKAAHMIEAQEESEKLVFDENGNPFFVASPTLVSVHVLRRQIETMGDMPGPLSLAQMKTLHPVDLELLQDASKAMEETALRRLLEGQTQRGRTDAARE